MLGAHHVCTAAASPSYRRYFLRLAAALLQLTEVLDSSSFMDPASKHAKANAIDLLQARFNRTQALQKLEHIHRVRHVMQFSLNPQHQLLGFQQMCTLDDADDAFTFTIKAVMRNLCRRQLLPKGRCPGGFQLDKRGCGVG